MLFGFVFLGRTGRRVHRTNKPVMQEIVAPTIGSGMYEKALFLNTKENPAPMVDTKTIQIFFRSQFSSFVFL